MSIITLSHLFENTDGNISLWKTEGSEQKSEHSHCSPKPDTSKGSCSHTHTLMYILIQTYKLINTLILILIHTYIHSQTHAHTFAHTYTHSQAYTYTHVCTHTQVYTYTRMHAYTHTHMHHSLLSQNVTLGRIAWPSNTGCAVQFCHCYETSWVPHSSLGTP